MPLGLTEGFGTVRKQNGAGLVGNFRPHTGNIVGFIVMGVVNSRDPESLARSLDEGDLVQQKRKTDGLEIHCDFEKVVISKHRPAHGAKGLHDAPGLADTEGMTPFHAVAEVSCDHSGIMRSGAY